MANMSYCRFQNTLGDLEDCTETLEDMGRGDLKKLPSDERQAAKRMVDYCRRYLDAAEELELDT